MRQAAPTEVAKYLLLSGFRRASRLPSTLLAEIRSLTEAASRSVRTFQRKSAPTQSLVRAWSRFPTSHAEGHRSPHGTRLGAPVCAVRGLYVIFEWVYPSPFICRFVNFRGEAAGSVWPD
jgi:hypothetical protein